MGDYTEELYQKQQTISVLCVLVKKEWERWENLYITKDLNSTELFQILCYKVATSLLEMVVVENLSTETNLRMRTSKSSIPNLGYFLWQMLEETPMDLNFSLPLFKHLG